LDVGKALPVGEATVIKFWCALEMHLDEIIYPLTEYNRQDRVMFISDE
jgi:hypothetical protein